jgi:hypothetical protein
VPSHGSRQLDRSDLHGQAGRDSPTGWFTNPELSAGLVTPTITTAADIDVGHAIDVATATGHRPTGPPVTASDEVAITAIRPRSPSPADRTGWRRFRVQPGSAPP